MAGKQNVSKEGKADSQVNVNLDTDTLSKSISDNLKKALGDLLAKDKNLSAEAMTEAVVAVVTGDITKMQKDINDQLTAQLADFQKSIDEQIATAQAASKGVDKSAAGEEVLNLNGTSFKKSAVGEHAFQAIKASAMQQEQLRKEKEKAVESARREAQHIIDEARAAGHQDVLAFQCGHLSTPGQVRRECLRWPARPPR